MTPVRPVAVVAVAAGLAGALLAGCGVNTKEAGQPTVAQTTTSPTLTTTDKRPRHVLPTRPAGVVAINGEKQNSLTGREAQTISGVRTNFAATGPGPAFQALCRGQIDIAEATRQIGPREAALCKANGIELANPIEIAADAIVVATKNDTDVGGDCLPRSTVAGIYRAGSTIDNWDQVNFFDIPLRTTGRDQGASIFDSFAFSVLGVADNPTLADFRADYQVHSTDDAVRKEVTNASRINAVHARYDHQIDVLARQEADRRNHLIAVAVRNAKAAVLRSIARENVARAKTQVRLTATRKKIIAEQNLQRVINAQNAARARVEAQFSTPELTHLRRLRSAALKAANRHGTVGYFQFSYYELYENELRPMEIWDPATARTTLNLAGVALTPPQGSDAPTPSANSAGPVVDPDTTPWCVFPSQLTITNGSYPLSRPLLLYVSDLNLKRGAVKTFLRAYLNRAQALARTERLVAIPNDLLQDELDEVNGVKPVTTTTTTAAAAPGGAAGTTTVTTTTTVPAATTPAGVAGVAGTTTSTTTTAAP